jgi:tetratricopeptide (TPR) repeat protein
VRESEDRLDEAENLFREAISFNPNYPFSRVSLMAVLLRKGSVKQAVDQFRDLAAINPEAVARVAFDMVFGRLEHALGLKRVLVIMRSRPSYQNFAAYTKKALFSLVRALSGRSNRLSRPKKRR